MPGVDPEALPAVLALQERVLRRALAADGLPAILQRLSTDLADALPHDALWIASRPATAGPTVILARWPQADPGPDDALPSLRPDWRQSLAPGALHPTLAGPADAVYDPSLLDAGIASHASLPVALLDGRPAVLTFASASVHLADHPGARMPWLASCLSACLAGPDATPTAHDAGPGTDPTELADYLCAAVAHDIRNIMSGIIGAVELHRSEMTGTQAAVFDAVRRRALDGVAMAESMRDYLCRSRSRELPLTDLAPVVSHVAELLTPVLQGTLGPGCPRLTLDLAPAFTHADPGEVHRAVTALVYNAARQCGPRNTITLRTRADARRACIEVEDDGPGLPEDVLRQAKAPFYTTLPGTLDGLGLAIADGVARVSDGSLSIRPGSQGGTRIIMALSLASQPDP